MARSRKVPFQETVVLPLRGITTLQENDQVLESVTIRAMTTAEERLRLSSTNGSMVIPNIIKSCIIDPEDVDVMNMNMIDINYIMYRLRALTYGSDYTVDVPCKNDRRYVSVTVNLNDISVENAPEGFTGEFELPALPVSGDVLTCKITSPKDIQKTEKECLRILNKFPDYVGDPELIIKWVYRITKINGDEAETAKTRSYIETMHARDFAFLEDKYEEIAEKYGMNLDMLEICPVCGETLEFRLPVTAEFFRPRY